MAVLLAILAVVLAGEDRDRDREDRGGGPCVDRGKRFVSFAANNTDHRTVTSFSHCRTILRQAAAVLQ